MWAKLGGFVKEMVKGKAVEKATQSSQTAADVSFGAKAAKIVAL